MATDKPMNTKNVDALAAIVLAMAEEFGSDLDGLEWDAPAQQRIAAWLADQGVLVPAALTLDDCDAIDRASHDPYDGALLEAEMRAALERVARSSVEER